MANSADPDQLASSEDLHSLQRQSISGFSRIRVNWQFSLKNPFINQQSTILRISTLKMVSINSSGISGNIKQEANGPQLAHLSETATADMQMACNIFPILLWQGNGLNSFWNILLTRLKCWNFQNVTSHPQCLLPTFESTGISVQYKKRKNFFQDGGHLGFPNGTIIAMFDLQVTQMLPTKFQVNWLLGLGEEVKNRFSRWLSWRPSWISDWHDFSYFWSTSHPDAS